MGPRDHIHVRIIFGQFGRLLSKNFHEFAAKLRDIGYVVHDDIDWNRPDEIIADIHSRQHKSQKEVLIGHSMGANCAAWVASAGQAIEFIGAIDPSSGWGPFPAAPPNPIGKNVKRCLCFVHTAWEPVGVAPFTGNAEIVPIDDGHLFMPGNELVQRKILNALFDVEKS